MGRSFFDFHEQATRRKKPASPAFAQPSEGGPAKKPSAEPVTVSQLTSRIDRLLRDGIPETVHVRGEISNFKPHQASGHLYFTLKDASTCIDCVMWKSDAVKLKFSPQDGIELVAGGKVSVYGQRGKYQFYVTSLRPMGQGALELAFQQLRAKLEGEGLFSAERKKPLPRYATNIVLVTSREAAACHDMLKVLERFPWLRVMIFPVPVQGDGAARQIAAAIAQVNARASRLGAEVILLARGGGSLEDLWAFNEEAVARAVAGSRLPVATGIGHEVDVSIADLVADYHAHTPTEAAQVITAHWRTARDDADALALRLRHGIRSAVQEARHRLRAVERHAAFRRPLDRIHAFRQVLDDRQRVLAMAMGDRVNAARRQAQETESRLERNLPATLRAAGQRLEALRQELEARIGRRLRRTGDQVARLAALLAECHPRYRVQLRAGRLASLSGRLDRAVRSTVVQHSQHVRGLERQLEALSPNNVLRRGFTLTMRKKDGQLIRSAASLKPGDRFVTRFADGEAESITQDARQLPLFE